MSFNLQARLGLEARPFLTAMNRVQRATERANRAAGLFRDNQGRLRDSMGRYAASANAATNANNRFGNSLRSSISGIGRMRGGLGGLTTGLLSVAGAYAAVAGASKIFQATVGSAATMEQSQTIIGAMIGDLKVANKYMKMMDDLAIKSPLLDSQTMYANSLGVVSLTKNLKEPLKAQERTWKIVERLTALNPNMAMGGGAEGAVFALRNLAAADIISLQDRFNLDKRVLNDLKHLTFEDQLTGLEKYLDKIGVGEKLINKMGSTTLGLWTQVKEQTQRILRDVGQPSLQVVSDFLSQILNKFESGELNRFANVGAKWMKAILGGLTSGVMSIYEWFNSLTSSPEFQSKTTLLSKVLFVFDDIWARFMNWVQGGGQGQINKITKDVLELLSAGLIMHQQIIVDTALIIGKAVGSAMASAAGDAFAGWAHKAMTESSIFNNKWLPGLKPFKWAMDAGMKLRENVKGKKAAGPQDYNSITNRITRQVPKRNGGVNYVRNDGEVYSLHRGEMVLPRGMADNYRKGKSGGGVTISGNTFYISGVDGNLEKAADQLMEILANKIEAAGGAGA